MVAHNRIGPLDRVQLCQQPFDRFDFGTFQGVGSVDHIAGDDHHIRLKPVDCLHRLADVLFAHKKADVQVAELYDAQWAGKLFAGKRILNGYDFGGFVVAIAGKEKGEGKAGKTAQDEQRLPGGIG